MVIKKSDKPKKILIDDGRGPGGGPREINVYEDHPIPVTRRDFMRMGLLSPAATLFTASPLLSLLQAGNAGAAEDCVISYNNSTKIVELDLAGGINGVHSFLVGRPLSRALNPGEKPGDLIQSHMLTSGDYRFMGFNPFAPGAIRTDVFGPAGGYGHPMNANSLITQGILAYASPAARSKTSMGVLCHESFADINAGQKVSCAALIAAVDRNPHFGNKPTETGTTKPSMGDIPTSSIPITAADSISALYSLGRSSITTRILDAAIAFNEGSRARMSRLKDGEKLLNTLLCTDAATKAKVAIAGAFNPTSSSSNPAFKESFQLSNPDLIEMKRVNATIALGLFSDLSNTASICVPECDYHDKRTDRAMEKARSWEIGVTIGGLIESAHRTGKKLVIVSSSDGNAVTDGTHDGKWDGDSAFTLSFVIYYDPAGATPIKWPQINGMKNSLEAEAHATNFNPQRVAVCLAANAIEFRDGNLNNFHKYWSNDGTILDNLIFRRRS